MRRFAPLLAVVSLLMAAQGTAVADEPAERTEVRVFEDVNPCRAPDTHVVTNVFNIKEHQHKNNTILVIEAQVTTDDGFEGTGHETTVIRDDERLTTFNIVLHNPDTGERFTAHIHFKLDLATGEFVVGSPVPTTRCLGS